ncbi:MAG: hypothetical protein IJ830_01395 [Alphaproteobacteria bacterium]|nr:hypothetical protein [Alphaproteobacteria bacterium]
MKNSLLITGLMVGVAFSGSAVAAGCPDGVCPAKYTCACDDAGNLREKTRVRGEETTIEAFDAAGHQTSYTVYDSADAVANNTPTIQFVYTYDAAGHRTSDTTYDSADAVANSRPDYQVIYTYDAAGHQTSSTSYNSADAITNNRPDSQTVNTYDAAGHQTSQTTYNSADAVANNTPTSQNLYNGNGTRIGYKHCSLNSCQMWYNGQLVASEVYNNGNWEELRQKIYFTYDEEGKVLSDTRYNVKDGSWYQKIFEYDDQGGMYETSINSNGEIVQSYYADRNDQSAHAAGRYTTQTNCVSQDCRAYDIHCVPGGFISNCTLDDFTYPFSLSNPPIDCSGSGYVSGCTGYREGADTLYNNPQIVCATGNISGCVADTVQLADGTSAMMQNGQIFNQFSDGSTTLYNADGTIKGYKGKRIYTVEEATKVSGERNTLRIRYK